MLLREKYENFEFEISTKNQQIENQIFGPSTTNRQTPGQHPQQQTRTSTINQQPNGVVVCPKTFLDVSEGIYSVQKHF